MVLWKKTYLAAGNAERIERLSNKFWTKFNSRFEYGNLNLEQGIDIMKVKIVENYKGGVTGFLHGHRKYRQHGPVTT